MKRRDEKRGSLGLCLRTDFALRVLGHEATSLMNSIPEEFNFEKGKQVKASWFKFSDLDALLDAWNSLETFPPWIAEGLARIRADVYDLTTAKEVSGDMVWDLQFGEKTPPELKQVRRTAASLAGGANSTRRDLSALIKALNS
jgi:hypothetical protein